MATAGIEPDAVVARSPAALTERVGAETVLLDPAHDTFIRLNRTGGLIWDALDEPRPAAVIAERLADDHDIPLERARGDLEAFVRQLEHYGLVEVRAP